MIKYGLKEFARNIYSNIFIAVQLAIAFIIMSAWGFFCSFKNRDVYSCKEILS